MSRVTITEGSATLTGDTVDALKIARKLLFLKDILTDEQNQSVIARIRLRERHQPPPTLTEQIAETHTAMRLCVDEWHEKQKNGCDVLASQALDELTELIQNVRP